MRRFKWQQRSGKIVAEVYDGIGAAPPNVGGDRFEGREIAVNVRNERQSHVSFVLGRVYPRRGKRRGLRSPRPPAGRRKTASAMPLSAVMAGRLGGAATP